MGGTGDRGLLYQIILEVFTNPSDSITAACFTSEGELWRSLAIRVYPKPKRTKGKVLRPPAPPTGAPQLPGLRHI